MRWGLGLGFLALGMAACRPAGSVSSGKVVAPPTVSSSDPADEHYDAGVLSTLKVELVDGLGGLHAVWAEVADTPQARERGLMWRRQLDSGHGMLFVFPADRPQKFWMKNTAIPLDMLFADRQGRVLGVVRNAQPFSLEGRGVDAPVRYVLELVAGTSEQWHLDVGSVLRTTSGKLPLAAQ